VYNDPAVATAAFGPVRREIELYQPYGYPDGAPRPDRVLGRLTISR